MPYWISVNSKLPSSTHQVLTYSDGEYLIDIFDEEWTLNQLLSIIPTHWMELPKPPIIIEHIMTIDEIPNNEHGK